MARIITRVKKSCQELEEVVSATQQFCRRFDLPGHGLQDDFQYFHRPPQSGFQI
jgi:hypothetical protein